MLISLNLLKKYINIKNIPLKKIVEKINISGFEVEDIKDTNIKNLVVGEIKKYKKIPKTHLNICTVFLGQKYGTKQIICGANNVHENMKVIVALPGAKLPKAEIKKATIYNYVSEGMCCSLSELGINSKTKENEKGIHELGKNFTVGEENIMEKMGESDVILNVKLPYNRPDLISIINFIKELSILFECDFKEPVINKEKINIKNDILTKINSKCSLFSTRIIKNIFFKETPIEIKKILTSSGIKTINNIVDYSNYVMILTGCPIHIYDYDKLPKKEISIEENCKKQEFIALNNKKYILNEKDIVATSNGKIICLSGIIGSLETSITSETKNIVIEIGNFDCFSIRRTSIKLNLLTESSKRFIQGINNYHYKNALEMLTSLIKKDCDNCLISEINENRENKKEENKKKLIIDSNEINNILNTKYSQEDMFKLLKKCFLDVKKAKKEKIIIYYDNKRKDIKNTNDIAEEILRFFGFEKINNELPKTTMSSNLLDKTQYRKIKIKNFLRTILYEVLTYTLISEKDIKLFNYLLNDKKEYKIVNPIINDKQYIRKSLIPSLLKVISYNLAHQNNNFGIFEISDINAYNTNEIFLSIALVGSYTLRGKMNKILYSIFYLKGIFETIYKIISKKNDENIFFFNDFSDEKIEKYFSKDLKSNFKNELHPKKSFFITYENNKNHNNNSVIGFLGELHPNIASEYGINEKTLILEINLSKFFECVDSNSDNDHFKTIKITNSRFVERDLCLLVDENISNAEVINIIKKSGGEFIKQVDLFDMYDDKKKNNKKSMSFNIVFFRDDKTLTNEEVNSSMEKILSALNKKNIFLRDDPAKKNIF